MRWIKFLSASGMLFSSLLVAQVIPAGTTLPTMLNSTLDARKDSPGRHISGRIMQDIPLPDGSRIPAGSRVEGQILQVSRPVAASGSQVVLKFDRLYMHGRSLPLLTDLRAIASMTEVYEAQLPTNALDDYGTSYSDWNTVQVGGDAVYRGNGEVLVRDEVVAEATLGGDVTGRLRAVPERGCRGAIDGNDREQALWVFSTSACGSYGFGDLKISHAGRTDPEGQIKLESAANVHVRGGSGLLLRVISASFSPQ